jgi:hypothetical protein
MSTNAEFAENLVKGKIAETIFAQMLRETGEFTVLEFGYEKVIPELIGSGYDEKDNLIETLRTAPDFAVINHTTKQVRLIEVKYRSHLDYAEILAIAKRMHESWNPSYLFIASKDGFYFDEITAIINKDGNISSLHHESIPASLQERYLELLREFEPETFIQKSARKSAKVLA